MKSMTWVIALLLGMVVHVSVQAVEDVAKAALSAVVDEPMTPHECACIASEKAYEVTLKDMKPEEWKKFLKKTTDYYDTWRDDNAGGDIKDFLDTQLITIAPGVKSGDIKVLKKFMCWMGLYHHFKEPVPWYVRDLAYENRASFKQMFQDFTWEKASQMVKGKVKEYEANPEKKKKYEQGFNDAQSKKSEKAGE